MRSELMRLLHACKQEPEDDTARLVLADWLEEHGNDSDQERAAFIRLQLESGPHQGRPAFQSLLEQRWEAAVRRWVPYHSRSTPAESERGLVNARPNPKAANGPSAQKTAKGEAWAWVEGVGFNPNPETLPGILASPLLDTVANVRLEHMNFGLAEAALLESSFRPDWRGLSLLHAVLPAHASLFRSPLAAGLRSLELSGSSRLLADGLEAFRDPDCLLRLEDLRLPGKGLTHDWIEGLRTSRRRLASLSLRIAHESAALRAIAEADSCAELRTLSFWEVRGEFRALPSLRCLPGLERLSVQKSRLLQSDGWLAGCPDAPRLRVLELPNFQLVSEELQDLAASPLAANLTHLDLSHNYLFEEGAQALTAMPAAPLFLNLFGCHLRGGLATLAAWPGLSRCRVLRLAFCELRDDDLDALARSPHVGGLVGLDLSYNSFTDAGVSRFLSCDWIGRLEQLDLASNNRVGFFAALRSAKLDAMRELVLSDHEASVALRREKPHIEFIGMEAWHDPNY